LYKLVTAVGPFFVDERQSLENKINALMEDGWTPQGGISVTQATDNISTWFIVAQAMVKNE